MEASTVVIKVKYGDTLRRFSASVVNNEMNLSMSQLTEKIRSLFDFASDIGIMLTYVDEDGDIVALVDDNDLRDVVKQSLNPLRITVKLSVEKNSTLLTRTTESSPALSPRVQLPFQNSNAVASEILKTVPDSLRETLVNLSADFASKVSSSAPGISPGVTELVNYFSNVGLSYLTQLSQSQSRSTQTSHSGFHESSKSSNETDDPTLSKFDASTFNVPSNSKFKKQESKNDEIPPELKPSAVKEDLDVNFESVTGGSVEASSSKGNSNHIKGSPDGRTECVSYVPKNSTSTKTPMISNPGDFNYGQSFFAHGSTFDCPFSGPHVENISASGMAQPASKVLPFNRSRSQNDGSGTVFHRGVVCDGCGVHPIVGPRFKSLVKVDYDLCGICFPKLGIESDYIRMNHPVMKPFHSYMHTGIKHPMFQKDCGGTISKQVAFKFNSLFVEDVNVLDGTVMAPLTPFTKIWRMKNNGRFPWPEKTHLVWIGGDKMSNSYSFQVEVPSTGLLVGQELEVAADFISPELPGRYISYWRMATPSGGKRFGQHVWVLIQVETTSNTTQSTGTPGLNLNLPLVKSVLTYPETINVDLAHLVEDSRTDSDNSEAKTETIDPEVYIQQPTIEQEMKFPDSLLIGSSSTSSAPAAPPSHLYPLVDLSDMTSATLPSSSALNPLPPPVGSAIAYTNELTEKEEVEKKLMRELEEMGFKQAALNKEILKMHEYDLEQAVAELCGVAEWDPILEELQEMGFHDTAMNKRLLKKNNGSIKRVVMDLIAGEDT